MITPKGEDLTYTNRSFVMNYYMICGYFCTLLLSYFKLKYLSKYYDSTCKTQKT